MLVETGRQSSFVDRPIEPFAPAAQRFGIMVAKTAHVAPFQPAFLRQGPKATFGYQHAAGEDVGLDEIGAARIMMEDRIVDQNILDRGAPAGLQQARDRIQIVGPIMLADRLHHFHAGDGLILPLCVAIVGQVDLRAGPQPIARIISLLDRQGQPVISDGAALHSLFGEAAPAASDFQQRLSVAKVKPFQQGVHLALLRPFQAFDSIIRIEEQGAGIMHIPVQP